MLQVERKKYFSVDSVTVVDWYVHMLCNYRCPYCWFDRDWERLEAEHRAHDTDLVLRRWREFNDFYGPAHVQCTGGEPTARPDFLALVEDMTRRNTVEINTNLSRPAEFWREFAGRAAPERCALDVSFHPQFARAEEFAANVAILAERGFEVRAIAVAYPPNLPALAQAAERLRGLYVHFRVQPFNGTYAGRVYPEAYSEDDRRLIRDLNRNDQFL